ncbi:MAG: PASTA domain-containing protein [Planctomycetaceae bacterium]|nr:PASTA domain-containing protein [Planctomycetaceae bacterium]
MLRFIFATSVLFVSFAAFTGPGSPACLAQEAPSGSARINDEEPLPPDLEKVLRMWADASSRIQRLEGEHTRRVYDYTFQVEKISVGKFFYESPDKGRIDISPADDKLMADLHRARNAGQIAAPKNEKGEMFKLEADKPEKWICDGVRVYEMNVPEKQAHIAQLPPQMQGTNIMNSPLPFLFGMPPEKARERFRLSFTGTFDPSSGFAMITALPRKQEDARNWERADIKLDLKSFLPTAVRIQKTREEIATYSFTNMKINERNWFNLSWINASAEKLFTPDLRDWNVILVGADPVPQPVEVVLPDLTNRSYKEAVAELQKLGLNYDQNDKPKQVLLQPGPVARRADDVYKVESMVPGPGTPLKQVKEVKLVLWNKPQVN